MEFFTIQRKSFPTFLKPQSLTFGWRRSLFGAIAPAQQPQSSLIPPFLLTSSGYSIANIFTLSYGRFHFHKEHECLPFAKMQNIFLIYSLFERNVALFPLRIELRTFSVLGRRDNHYTMETAIQCWIILKWLQNTNDHIPTSSFHPQYLQICNAQRGARTPDPEIKSLMLYRLS